METRNSRLSETLDSKSTGSLMSQSFLLILASVSKSRKHGICIKYPPPNVSFASFASCVPSILQNKLRGIFSNRDHNLRGKRWCNFV